MTLWDLIALAIVAGSALAGWVRGGAREVITFFSFILAAFIALIALPATAPLARAIINPDWLGWLAAAIVTFLIVYGLIKLGAAVLSRKLRDSDTLETPDRIIGLSFGVLRSLVLLGAIHLVLHAAVPAERVPGWFRDSAFFPVSKTGARLIQWILPGVGRGVDRLAPVVSGSVKKGVNPDAANRASPEPQSPPSLIPPPNRKSQSTP
ncbi:MAG TPA: CvpA family protein [Caulobacteraceae bacterium]|jgi:membrane protein required for colicin V production